jgi:Concanavalin A-like lectin/glucanases superfamily
MMLRRVAAVAFLAVLVSGCTSTVRAAWNMNELVGPTMVDSAGDHDGTASNVAFNQPGHEGAAYGFNGSNSIVRVPHAADLSPGTSNFSFGAWVNFTQLPPPQNWDMLRKGTVTSSASYYKLEVLTGSAGTARARCFFRDTAGVTISVVRGSNLNDGQWHQLTCSRVGNDFKLTVDGGTSTNPKTLGSITNTAELSVGGKLPSGDSFNGRIDQAQVSVG